MNGKEKESREQPKEELCIHGRGLFTAMDMPQSKRNENPYFADTAGKGEW